jgi:AraC-like DNA-binding protein
MNKEIVTDTYELNTAELKLKGFKGYSIDTAVSPAPTYSRRDFYKVCLVTGNSNIHYANSSIACNGTVLFFANPHIPYSTEVMSGRQTGYACLFTETFLKTQERSESLQQSPLFKIGVTPVFPLNDKQKDSISSIFEMILSEQDTGYIFKDDLIRNYIHLIVHEALKMQPVENFTNHKTASSRLTALFLELLERQFPVENTDHPLTLKTAQDYANRLAVHVNHLNRAVKEVTGKPTTTHISGRIISEAKALLQHTDWTTADIAYALGFEYPTYFNNFFKRLTGTIPKALRV